MLKDHLKTLNANYNTIQHTYILIFYFSLAALTMPKRKIVHFNWKKVKNM